MAHNAPFATCYNVPSPASSRASTTQPLPRSQPLLPAGKGGARGGESGSDFSLLAYLRVPAPTAASAPARATSSGDRGVRVVAPVQRPPRVKDDEAEAPKWVDPPPAGRPSRRSPRLADPTLQQPDAKFWAQTARPVASPRGVTPTRPARRRIPLPPRVVGPPGGADGGDARSERGAAPTSPSSAQPPPPPPPKEHLAHARASGNQAAKYTEGLLIVNPEFTHKARRAPAPPWTDRERHEYLMRHNSAVDEQATRKAIRGYTGMVPPTGHATDNTNAAPAANAPPPLPPTAARVQQDDTASWRVGGARPPHTAASTDSAPPQATAPVAQEQGPQGPPRDPERRPSVPGSTVSASDRAGREASSLEVGESSPPRRGRFTDREFAVMRTVRAYHDRRGAGQGTAPYATGHRPQRAAGGRQSEAHSGSDATVPREAPHPSPLNRRLVFGAAAADGSTQRAAPAWPKSPRTAGRGAPPPEPANDGSPSSILDLQAQATSRQLVHLRQRQGQARAHADRVSDQHRAESAQSAVALQRQQRLAAKLAAQGDLPEASHVRKLAEQQRRASRRREAQQRAELDKRRREELAFADEARRARDRLYQLREAQAHAQAAASRKRDEAARRRADDAALLRANPFVQPVDGRERGDVDLQAAGLIPGMRARRKARVHPQVAPGSQATTRAAAQPSPGSTVLDTDEYLRRLDAAVQREAQLLTREMEEGQRARAQDAERQRLVAEATLHAQQRKQATTSEAVADWDTAVAHQRARRGEFERLKAYERAKQEQLTRDWYRETAAQEQAARAQSRSVQQVLERQRYLADLQKVTRGVTAAQTPSSALSFI